MKKQFNNFQEAVDEKFKSPTKKDMDTLYLCAFMYCLDRATYMPGLVQDILKKVELSERVINIMLSDIKNSPNKENWKDFKNYLKKQV